MCKYGLMSKKRDRGALIKWIIWWAQRQSDKPSKNKVVWWVPKCSCLIFSSILYLI